MNKLLKNITDIIDCILYVLIGTLPIGIIFIIFVVLGKIFN